MQNYKITDVLRSLDTKELKRFGEFVTSPYFNKNKPVRKLFEALQKFYPKFNNRNFTIEKVFKNVFPKEKYDYHKINNVISDLYKLSEKYLAQIQIEKKDYYIERNIFRELRDKGLYKIYEQKYSSYMKELIDRRYKDEDYFYYMYEMNDEYLWYATIKKPNTELNILQTEFDHFHRYALLRLLRFYNLMLHERNQNNVQYRLTMFNEVLDYISRNEEDGIPAIQVFKTILILLHTKDRKYYSELWELKEKNFNELKHDDQYLLFIHLYDFAAYMVNFKGDDSYNQDMFDIYKELIERKFMTPENFLYPNFMNVVKVACRMREYKYAENFIRNFQSSIPPADKENVLAFCYGTLELGKGNLQKALTYFSKSNFQNFIFKVQVKILLLKIYYKLGMFQEALGMIDTFRHFVGREQNLLDDHKESYNRFINLMGKLIRIRENNAKNDIIYELEKMKQDADTIPANPFRIKVWLIDELNSLKSAIPS